MATEHAGAGTVAGTVGEVQLGAVGREHAPSPDAVALETPVLSTPSTHSTAREVTVGMRRWLWLDSVLVFVTGIQCFVLSEYTAQFFAWTVNPPLTAAFLGACYWAAFPFVFLSARERVWANCRVALYGVFTFTALTLIATLLHLDRFHLSSPEPLARAAAWAWMVVYVLVPPSLLVLLLRQARAPGGDPVRSAPLPLALRAVLGLQTAVLVPLGAALLLAPLAARPLWPWMLSELTGRAVGCWLIGMGITFGHAALENDWPRVRPVMVGYTLLGALQLAAVVRYAGTINWSTPSAWLYALFVVTVLAVGAYGWRASSQAAPVAPVAPAAPAVL